MLRRILIGTLFCFSLVIPAAADEFLTLPLAQLKVAAKAPSPAGAPLASKAVTSDSAFREDVARLPQALVMFGAEWCPGCIAKDTKEAFASHGTTQPSFKIDVDKFPELFQEYGQGTGIPQYAVLEYGRVVKSRTGALRTADAIRRFASPPAVASK